MSHVLFYLICKAEELDEAAVEGLVREFAASWKSGIEAINQDVLSFFSNVRNGMEILKQVIFGTNCLSDSQQSPTFWWGKYPSIRFAKVEYRSAVVAEKW